MSTSVDILRIRKALGRNRWEPPIPFGPDGWRMSSADSLASVIVSSADHDGAAWVHASTAHADQLPTYADLVALHQAVWPTGWAYQVFAPPSEHVNIHPHALHLWGRRDGARVLPDFAGELLPGMRSI